MSYLKKWIKSAIKKTLIRFLEIIDDGFLAGRGNAISITSDVSKIENQNRKSHLNALVVNEDGVITNEGVFDLLVQSIFEKSELNSREKQIVDSVKLKKKIWSSHHEVVEAIFSELKINIDPNDPVSKTDSAIYCQLKLHLEKTDKSKKSYLLDGKTNPSAVFWPDPTNSNRPSTLKNQLPWAKQFSFIDRSTPIGSAGSCFAVEIAHRLQSNGFNYVITEPHLNPGSNFSNSCARWGIIFNTPSFRQLVERAFGVNDLPNIVWSRKNGNSVELLDPFREDISFQSIEEYERDLSNHVSAAREALLKAKVFVLTLGVNEVWKLKSDGSVFSRAPWRIASSLVERKVMSVEDNVNELEAMLKTWRKFNPDIKLVISVSPVPLHATFRGEEHHVISANALSKSTLRVAAEEFVKRNDGVYYFPSYETVMYCTENAWAADERHVSREAVGNVMKLFDHMFLAEQAKG